MVHDFLGEDGCAEFAGVDPERATQLEDVHDLFDAGALCECALNVAADAGGVEVRARRCHVN